MFTGIIEETGYVKSVSKTRDGITLHISAVKVLEGTKKGDSISINGACQTVTDISDGSFAVFASTVTARVTTLGDFKAGRRVNLERAMTHSSRFGGHIVQGHADGNGVVTGIERDSMGMRITISVETEIYKYIVERGSIAVDGISLTIVSLADNCFVIYIIPETLKSTIVNDWGIGVKVNIEVDILAKYVDKWMSFMNSKDKKDKDSDEEKLKNKLIEEGFA